jgi:biotin carboxyl carrier protein
MSKTDKSLVAIATPAPENDGQTLLGAPHIGRFELSVEAGQLIEAGQQIGTLRVLKGRVHVLAPQGISGRVQLTDRSRERAVAHGDTLFTLTAAEATDGASASAATAGLDLGDNEVTFDAPTDGLFYRSPSPEDPVFKEIGDEVTSGDTIGLIEVMKFFYPIAYDGVTSGKIARFLVEDATPVVAGQPLMVISKG